MRWMCHGVSMLVGALAIAGCYQAHERSGGGLCGPPLGHVCCLPSGFPAGVAPQECPFVCPPGTELRLEAACVPGPRDAGPRPDARPPLVDAAVLDAGPLPPGCGPRRADSTCLASFLAPPGVPFTLPVTFEVCGCCPGTVCGARADPATRTLHLTTSLCEDPCDCDSCVTPTADCEVPPLEAGMWSVVVNGAPAFQLPVFEDSGVVPPPPACASYAAPDPCASDLLIDPIARVPNRTCVRDDLAGRTELFLTHECLGCADLVGPCVVALEPRFTADLPPGGELRVLETTHTFECDVDCPEVCMRLERVCELPPLVPGDFYRVWMGDSLLTSFTAGVPQSCEADPIPPG